MKLAASIWPGGARHHLHRRPDLRADPRGQWAPARRHGRPGRRGRAVHPLRGVLCATTVIAVSSLDGPRMDRPAGGHRERTAASPRRSIRGHGRRSQAGPDGARCDGGEPRLRRASCASRQAGPVTPSDDPRCNVQLWPRLLVRLRRRKRDPRSVAPGSLERAPDRASGTAKLFPQGLAEVTKHRRWRSRPNAAARRPARQDRRRRVARAIPPTGRDPWALLRTQQKVVPAVLSAGPGRSSKRRAADTRQSPHHAGTKVRPLTCNPDAPCLPQTFDRG